jgi:hypothetical protein
MASAIEENQQIHYGAGYQWYDGSGASSTSSTHPVDTPQLRHGHSLR